MRYHEISWDIMRYHGISWDIRDLRVLEISIFLRFSQCHVLLLLLKLSSQSSAVSHGCGIGILWSFCLHLRDANPWHKFSKSHSAIVENIRTVIVHMIFFVLSPFFVNLCAKRCQERAVAGAQAETDRIGLRPLRLSRVVWNDETGHFKWRDHVVRPTLFLR